LYIVNKTNLKYIYIFLFIFDLVLKH